MSNIEDLFKDYRTILILAGIFFIFCGLAETVNFRPLPGSESYFRGIGGILLTIGIILHFDVINKKYVWFLPLIIGVALFSLPVQTSQPPEPPTPTTNIIDSMEKSMVWHTDKDDKGSSINKK